jgi:hypothetical protein
MNSLLLQIAFSLLEGIDVHPTHVLELQRIGSARSNGYFAFWNKLTAVWGNFASLTQPNLKFFSTDQLFAFSAMMGGGS